MRTNKPYGSQHRVWLGKKWSVGKVQAECKQTLCAYTLEMPDTQQEAR